jgi:uncharacterized YccA/Bax inhibitor family protein
MVLHHTTGNARFSPYLYQNSPTMSILISVVICLVILGLLIYLTGLLPIDPRFRQVIIVLLVIVAILYLVRVAGWWSF